MASAPAFAKSGCGPIPPVPYAGRALLILFIFESLYADKPRFLAGYATQTATDGSVPDREALLADLLLLEKAGITRETGLKTIAA